ncbi:MAG: ClpXP protease specificity-enhancing factor SspB [Pseudomonadota bacterium]
MSQKKWGSAIPYDALVKSALKQVAIQVLQDAAENGLRGDHHFYIAFHTHHPRVAIPRHLMEKYPEEMTIVVQHRFWGLKVHTDHFEIGLSFNQRPERLVIPFDAMIGFVDPSVHFALQFDGDMVANAQDEAAVNAPELAELGSEPSVLIADDRNSSGTPDNKVVTLDAFRKKS